MLVNPDLKNRKLNTLTYITQSFNLALSVGNKLVTSSFNLTMQDFEKYSYISSVKAFLQILPSHVITFSHTLTYIKMTFLAKSSWLQIVYHCLQSLDFDLKTLSTPFNTLKYVKY